MRQLLTLILFLFSASAFAQTFEDTSGVNAYIRENIRDKRPEKVTAEQLQTGMLGLSNTLSKYNAFNFNLRNNTGSPLIHNNAGQNFTIDSLGQIQFNFSDDAYRMHMPSLSLFKYDGGQEYTFGNMFVGSGLGGMMMYTNSGAAMVLQPSIFSVNGPSMINLSASNDDSQIVLNSNMTLLTKGQKKIEMNQNLIEIDGGTAFGSQGAGVINVDTGGVKIGRKDDQGVQQNILSFVGNSTIDFNLSDNHIKFSDFLNVGHKGTASSHFLTIDPVSGFLKYIPRAEGQFIDSSKISSWGASGDTSVDFTSPLSSAMAWVKSRGIKYLNIDKNIKVSGRLSFDKKDVLFYGAGKIFTKNINNYGESEVGGSYYHAGNINNKHIPLRTAAKIAGHDSVNIVVWGNSISVGYDADLTDFKPDPHYIDGRVSTNNWYDYWVNKMWLNYRGRPIKIFNRSAGGYRIEDYNRPLSTFCCGSVDRFKTASNKDSTWIQVIKQLKPDLIILSLGMNDSDEFIKWLYRAKDSINLWEKKPEIVIMSTPSPNYINDMSFGDFGDYDKRVTKMNVSRQQRWVSNAEKFYLIDVARLHDINRYGVDYTNYGMNSSNGYHFDSISNVSVSSLSTFNTTGTNATIRAARNNKTSDYSVKFNWQYSGSFDYVDIRNKNYSITRITPVGIDLYSFVVPSERNVGFVSAPYSFSGSTSYKIEVVHAYNSMRVYVNDSLIITSPYGAVASVTDPIVDIFNNSGVHSFSNFTVFDSYYKHYFPTLTGSEMWGTTSDLQDGNHINHPSTEGLTSTYFKAIDEFFTDFKGYVQLYDSTVTQWSYDGSTLYNNGLGNVGIGTKAANEKLSVNGSLLLDMGGTLLSPVDTRQKRYGLKIHANTDTASVWLESTGDETGNSNMVFQMADNRTSTGGSSEGFIFRKTGGGDVPPQPDFDLAKFNQDSAHFSVKLSGITSQFQNSVDVGGYGNGFLRLNKGDVSNAGWMGFYLPNGTRIGYLGSSPASRIDYNAEGGAVHYFSGGNVGVGEYAPTSTIHVAGSFASAITTTGSNITLNDTHGTIVATSPLTITLPSASSCPGRIYRIINYNTGGDVSYAAPNQPLRYGSTATVQATNTAWQIQSNGTSWYATGQ